MRPETAARLMSSRELLNVFLGNPIFRSVCSRST